MFSKKETTLSKAIAKTFANEEWIWIEGYKGTDKNMKCRDFQYEIGKQFDSEGDIEKCESGFHLCLELSETFDYYQVGGGNRYFKVKALVKKTDFDNYYHQNDRPLFYIGGHRYVKIVAKSIVFISEIERDEILKNCCDSLKNAPEKYKDMAIAISPTQAKTVYRTDTLIADGYSETFVKYLIEKGKFDIAHSLGTQTNLSMDMKCFCIFSK